MLEQTAANHLKSNEIVEVILNATNQTLHDKLLVSSDDIAISQFCATVLQKKGWHANPWECRGTIYEKQTAFTTALITAYARVFTKSEGWPRFPSDLLAYDDREAALHERILILRDQVYAHSDSTRYTIKPFAIADTPITIIKRPALRLTADEVSLFLAMTNKLLSTIKEKIQQILNVSVQKPIATDRTSLNNTPNIVIHKRKGGSPKKRHGLIIVELDSEPLDS